MTFVRVVDDDEEDEGPQLPQPIDWPAFWASDHESGDWLIDEFWPRSRSMALWAKAKEGKSEFVLHCVASLATGVDPFTGQATTPARVLYFDFEMTEEDLWDRLTDMGYDQHTDLELLRYYQLPMLEPMDTARGAAQVARILDVEQPDCVVVDTFGRAVEGEEDRADTIRAFYAHTGLMMKNRRIGYLRTDHAGKAMESGQRGSSAKNDDVDVIWKLYRTKGGIKLESKSRVSAVKPALEFDRLVEPLKYRKPPTHTDGFTTQMFDKARHLDSLSIPRDWGRRKIHARLTDLGEPIGDKATLDGAIRWRKKQP